MISIAVLSDIHGNYIALQACLDYILKQGITTFVFLGDYVAEFAYPERTMDMLYELKEAYTCYFVKGNKEDYWLNHRKGGAMGWPDFNSTTGSLCYAYEHLREQDFAFFEELSHKGELQIEDLPPVTICHGSPNRTNEKIMPGEKQALEILAKEPNDMILCGHIHIQSEICHNGKRAINPGSVGVPLNSDGQTQFLILHGEAGCWRHEFVSLTYDRERAIQEMYEVGLHLRAPYWCKITEKMLRDGLIAHGQFLDLAMELCREETGVCKWPNIPEACWERAWEKLGMEQRK